MQERYTVAIKNRFYALHEKEEKEETAAEKYQRFIEASRSATEEIVPVLQKAKKLVVSNNQNITKIRKKVNTEYNIYQNCLNKEAKAKLECSKAKLFQEYDTIKEKGTN